MEIVISPYKIVKVFHMKEDGTFSNRDWFYALIDANKFFADTKKNESVNEQRKERGEHEVSLTNDFCKDYLKDVKELTLKNQSGESVGEEDLATWIEDFCDRTGEVFDAISQTPLAFYVTVNYDLNRLVMKAFGAEQEKMRTGVLPKSGTSKPR
jgi:hypothetical protein